MRGNFVSNGDFGLQATEPCWITSNQIEAARIAMTRYTKRGGQVWIKIFPDKPVTEKPAETRMGSGKGSPEYWHEFKGTVQTICSMKSYFASNMLQMCIRDSAWP